MQKSLKRKREDDDELRPGGLYLDTVIIIFKYKRFLFII